MQGFNMGRYVPPDHEGLTSGNALHKSHPLGHRARKMAQGILTVRFEMPFPIWCATCPNPTVIGQGVRFNAEKKRVGSYYTTPIWSFRFRHAECGGPIEMRTDPRSRDFEVVEGARRRDTGEEEVREGDVVVLSEEERERLRQSAFARLERTIEDRERASGAARRVGELEDVSARQWDDPYARNRELRRTFRVERKRLEKETGAAEDLKDRMSLGIDLLPATETDALRASLVDFGPEADGGAGNALAKPLFSTSTTSSNRASKKDSGKTKSEILASKRKDNIVSEIVGNTRIIQDPFLAGSRGSGGKSTPKVAGVKRKQTTVDLPGNLQARDPLTNPPQRVATAGLVDYDSE